MKTMLTVLVAIFYLNPYQSLPQSKKGISKLKTEVITSVNKHSAELTDLSDQIWSYAETALKEYKSSEVLSNYAESQGFRVERGIDGMPTAFTAEYGEGRPIIGILGEFDALPGISQKAIPIEESRVEGGAGHGCGHNLFGAGSIGAAVAIKELMEQGKLKGTLRFYGTPAEEALGGKIYMARDGFFDDLDLCMDWHPGATTRAGAQSSKAMIDFNVEFFGKTAHASGDPWNGRSALDAIELFGSGVNMLREHILPTVRIHYVITDGGDVPNVVPKYAKTWIWIRDSKRSVVQEVYDRVIKIAEGAALMTEVDYKASLNSGDYEILVNRTGGQVVRQNLELLGPITYTPEEIEFAKTIQRETGKEELGIDSKIVPYEETKVDPDGGSTDVGDVSWVTPVVRLRMTTAAAKTPWHSWAVVACGGMTIGHKGLLQAAKTLSMSMIDIYQDEKLRQDIRAEFEKRRNGHVFEAMLPDGPPPVPKVKSDD